MSTPAPTTGWCTRYAIGASYDNLRPVRESFRDMLVQMYIGEEAIHNWLVVFNEAMANAIEHGARQDPKQQIKIRWIRLDNTIELIVSDPGIGFMTQDSSALLRSSGRGLKLIESFCDSVEHLINPGGGHTIRLCKTHPEIKASQAEQNKDDGYWLKLLEDFYGGLTHAIPAAALLAGMISYVAEKLGPETDMEIRVLPEYTTPAEKFAIYKGAPPCERCEMCEPIKNGKSIIGVRGTKVSCWPLKLDKRNIGALVVTGQNHQNSDNKIILEQLSKCIALGLESERQQNNQRVMSEAIEALSIASNLQSRQRQIRESSLEMPGRIYTYEERAQTVAGDIVECAPSIDGGNWMLIADVMGKGVAAAFLGGIFRGGWHLISKKETHPLLLIRELNQFLFDELNGQSMFVTVALAHIGADAKTLSIVNAGHTPIFIQDRSGRLIVVEPSGPPLGLFPQPKYQLYTHSIAELERLYMPTDGLYCWGKSPGDYDPNKLKDIFASYARKPIDQLWDNIQYLRKNSKSSHIDDQSILVWENEKVAQLADKEN